MNRSPGTPKSAVELLEELLVDAVTLETQSPNITPELALFAGVRFQELTSRALTLLKHDSDDGK